MIIQVGSTSGNNAPVADAGTAQSVQLGASVVLDASGSTDADGDPLSYLWVFDQLPSGSTLTDMDITQAGGTSGSFTPDVSGIYTLMVGVSDGMDYDNLCSAQAAGVDAAASGACGRPNLCGLPADSGPCFGAFPHFYFDAAEGQCRAFVYGGCEGNANNFETLEACVAACG